VSPCLSAAWAKLPLNENDSEDMVLYGILKEAAKKLGLYAILFVWQLGFCRFSRFLVLPLLFYQKRNPPSIVLPYHHNMWVSAFV